MSNEPVSIFSKRPPTNPAADGSALPKEEINRVAKTMYNRFQHQYGLTPCWGDNAKVDENCRQMVKKAIDSLQMCGYKITKVT